MKKITFLFLAMLVSGFLFAQTKTDFTGGIYWTYEDFKNDKLEVKGNFTNMITTVGNITAVFTNAQGEKEKVNVIKCFAFRDEFGSLWRIHKNAGAMRAIVKGNACFYVKDFMGEIECKKGRAKLAGAVIYVSKGFDGEIVYGGKKVKEVVADDTEAYEIVSKDPYAPNTVIDGYALYNKKHPLPGDYVIPDCSKVE